MKPQFSKDEKETWKRLGSGLEGVVFKIAPNLVCKIWHLNFFGKTNVITIVRRLKQVNEIIAKAPATVRKHCHVPEFAGYEVVRCDHGGHEIRTYHEYVLHTKKSVSSIYDGSVPGQVLNFLEEKFYDAASPNVIKVRGKIYLLDVAVRK